MAIQKAKHKGKTRYIVSASKRDSDGKRYQRKRYAPNLPLAKALERQLFSELNELVNGKIDISWSEFLKVYVEYVTTHQFDTNKDNLDDEIGRLNEHITPVLGERKLRSIKARDIRVVMANQTGHLAPKTKSDIIRFMRKLFDGAIELEYIDRNPAQYIKFSVPKSRRRTLPSSNEITAFISQARQSRDILPEYYIWHFIMLTGLRSGEAYALRWRSVKIEDEYIDICESWTRKRGTKYATKNDEIRQVPLSDELKDFLLELKKITFQGKDSYVLPHPRSWTQSEGAKTLKAFLAGMDIRPMTLHDLRAVYITKSLREGYSIPWVMKVVGHKRMDTTERYLSLAGLDVIGTAKKFGYLPNNAIATPKNYETFSYLPHKLSDEDKELFRKGGVEVSFPWDQNDTPNGHKHEFSNL